MNAITRSSAAALAAVVLFSLHVAGNSAPAAQVEKRALEPLSLAEIQRALDAPGAHDPFVPPSELGLPSDLSRFIPEKNPLTRAKVELGRQLYFEPRLSKDATVSCATCHHPSKGWADGLPVSSGIEGKKGGRNSPTVLNRLFGTTQFWDGRAATLEEQALGPIGNPIEMGFSSADAAARLASIPGYRIQFERVFGGPPTADGIAMAIAAFERTILSGANANDYTEAALPYRAAEPDEDWTKEDFDRRERALADDSRLGLSAAGRRGRELFFGKAECSTCHVGANLTDELFYNLGVGFDPAKLDQGREAVTGNPKDRGAYKTPTLRNVALTAPYMHDGSFATLRDVVEHYNRGGLPDPWLSNRVRKLGLAAAEVSDVVAFLEELTGTIPDVAEPRLPE